MEVNAQNMQQVMETLIAAAGADSAARAAAQETLERLQEVPGYASCLLVRALFRSPLLLPRPRLSSRQPFAA